MRIALLLAAVLALPACAATVIVEGDEDLAPVELPRVEATGEATIDPPAPPATAANPCTAVAPPWAGCIVGRCPGTCFPARATDEGLELGQCQPAPGCEP